MEGSSWVPTSAARLGTKSKLYWEKGDLKWNLGKIYFLMY